MTRPGIKLEELEDRLLRLERQLKVLQDQARQARGKARERLTRLALLRASAAEARLLSRGLKAGVKAGREAFRHAYRKQ